MERTDWEWADEALRDDRCSAEFASEAATRCEALRKQRDEWSEACSRLVRWCNDPVIAETPLTISEVRVTRDLRQPTVYLVELGGALSDDVKAALERAAPFIRGEVARAANLKYAPTLTFRPDETFAESARIDALLDEARRARGDAADDRTDDDGGNLG